MITKYGDPIANLTPIKKQEREYLHGESYRLMQYVDKVTGKKEIIWNSRDGVTPFAHESRDGNQTQHVEWESDVFAEFHVPDIGDRIWMTATHALVEEQAKKYVDGFWNNDQYTMSEYYDDVEGDEKAKKAVAYEKTIREFVDCGDQPWCVVVDDRLHEMFKRRKEQYETSQRMFKRSQEIQKENSDPELRKVRVSDCCGSDYRSDEPVRGSGSICLKCGKQCELVHKE